MSSPEPPQLIDLTPPEHDQPQSQSSQLQQSASDRPPTSPRNNRHRRRRRSSRDSRSGSHSDSRSTTSTDTNTAGAPTKDPSSAVSSTHSPSLISPSLSSSVSGFWGGLVRRFSSETSGPLASPAPYADYRAHHNHNHNHNYNNGLDGAYTAANIRRPPSPLQLPPLEPLQLTGFREDTDIEARLLTTAVADEIRILVPARLSLSDEWRLVYSLEQDGASLTTLYQKCSAFAGKRVGYVLVVKDAEGGIFGAYLSEMPHPAPGYFGTGECFLWRASVMLSLPPPPSADTTHLNARVTTIAADPPPALVHAPNHSSSSYSHARPAAPPSEDLILLDDDDIIPDAGDANPSRNGAVGDAGAGADRSRSRSRSRVTSGSTTVINSSRSASVGPTPASPSIRFKAFPYSGVNDYYMLCEAHFLSVGAGDGKYGLWLDGSLEKGVSSTCLTFGNERLSEQGDKFGVLGVEMWVIGAT